MRFKINNYDLKTSIFFFFLIIWQFDLGYLSTIPRIDLLYNIGKISSFAIIIVIMLVKRKFEATKFFFLVILYSIILVLSTIINAGSLFNAISMGISLISFYLIIHEMLRSYPLIAISTILFLFELMIYTNVVLMIRFPRGIYNINQAATKFYWLFGQQNANTLYSLCAILTATIFLKINNTHKNQIRVFLLVAAAYLNVFISKSITGIIGMIIMTLVLIINKNKNKINLYAGLIISLSIFFVIVILQSNVGYSFIISTLGRDATFSGRTKLWALALEAIEKKPILGWGVEKQTIFMQYMGFDTPHNKMLYTLYQGGIFLLGIFISMILETGKSVQKNKVFKNILNAILIALIIQMQSESYIKAVFFFPFIVSDNINFLVSIQKENANLLK